MELSIEEYTNKVVQGLLNEWPENFKKYVGINAESVEDIAADYREQYSLVKYTISDLWEMEVDVDEAISRLYIPLNTYFNGTASVM